MLLSRSTSRKWSLCLECFGGFAGSESLKVSCCSGHLALKPHIDHSASQPWQAGDRYAGLTQCSLVCFLRSIIPVFVSSSPSISDSHYLCLHGICSCLKWELNQVFKGNAVPTYVLNPSQLSSHLPGSSNLAHYIVYTLHRTSSYRLWNLLHALENGCCSWSLHRGPSHRFSGKSMPGSRMGFHPAPVHRTVSWTISSTLIVDSHLPRLPNSPSNQQRLRQARNLTLAMATKNASRLCALSAQYLGPLCTR